MGAERQVKVTVLGDSTSGQRALTTLGETGEATATKLGGIGDKIGSALSPAKLAAGAGALTGILGSSIAEVGDKLEKSQKQLEAAASAAGIPLKQIDDIASSTGKTMEGYAFTTTQTNTALQQLVQAGRPAEEVTKDMGIAADLAKAKHISLSDAAGLIAKVYGGNSKVLKQFGIDLKSVADPQKELTTAENDATKAAGALTTATESNRIAHLAYDAQKTHSAAATEQLRQSDLKLKEAQDQARITTDNLHKAQADAADGTTRAGNAIDELAGKLHGQAAASMDTFGGKLEIVKVKMEDFITKGAAKVGPALVSAGPLVMGFGGILQSGLLPALASGVTGAVSFAGGMIGAGISAAGAALPVIVAWAPVVLAIAAVGIAGYELYKHWDEVFGFVKKITLEVTDWVKSHLELIALVVLAPVAPLILLVTHWGEAWGFVKDITGEAWSWLRKEITGGIDDVVGFVAGLPGRAVDALSSLGGDIAGVATRAMSSMWDATSNGASDLVGFVEGIPGRIVDAMGDLSGLLWDAGAAVLRGFLGGLKSVWGDVTGFVGGIGGWIANHKGPIEYDRQLLVPHGLAIMAGLGQGIQTGQAALSSTLASVTRQVSGVNVGAGGSGGGGLAAIAGSGPAGGAGDVHIHIHAGTVVGVNGAQDLAKMVRDELLRYQRRVPSLGFS